MERYDEMSLGHLPVRELDKLVQRVVIVETPGHWDRWKLRHSWEREKWWRRFLPANEVPEYCRSHEGMGLIIEKLGILGFTITIEPRGQNIHIVSREGKETTCTVRC
jgi:hypothetical protein